MLTLLLIDDINDDKLRLVLQKANTTVTTMYQKLNGN